MHEQRVEMLEQRVKDLESMIEELMKFIAVDGDNLSIRAKGNLSISGLNVSVAADACASVKGAASAELLASGQTTVKGAMVLIN